VVAGFVSGGKTREALLARRRESRVSGDGVDLSCRKARNFA
jgi:hypothetical protein